MNQTKRKKRKLEILPLDLQRLKSQSPTHAPPVQPSSDPFFFCQPSIEMHHFLQPLRLSSVCCPQKRQKKKFTRDGPNCRFDPRVFLLVPHGACVLHTTQDPPLTRGPYAADTLNKN